MHSCKVIMKNGLDNEIQLSDLINLLLYLVIHIVHTCRIMYVLHKKNLFKNERAFGDIKIEKVHKQDWDGTCTCTCNLAMNLNTNSP